MELIFEPPGPGTWVLDTQHFPTPLTRFTAEVMPETIARTMTETMAKHGMLILTTSATVNGFYYGYRRPIETGFGDSGILTVEDPEVRRRVDLMADGIRSKFWRDGRRRWFEEVRPDSIEVNLGLASIEVTQLSRQELFDHLATCRENVVRMCERHHTFNQIATSPVALLVLDVTEWTDLTVVDALSLLDGASPISAGITPELIRLADEVRTDTDASALVQSDESPAAIFKTLRNMAGPVGEAAERFWLMDGHRLATGFDVSAKNAYELPEMMLNNLRNTVASDPPDQTGQAEALARFVRNQVPDEHRTAFDEELADARANTVIKDERGLYNDVWACGIARKALLEAGSRLVDEGRLRDREHFMEAGWEEMQEVWSGSGGPTPEELSDRRDLRMSLNWMDAPPILGDPPAPPLEIEGLPAEVARMEQASALLGQMTGQRPPPQDGEDLVGVTASKGDYEGTARVVVGDYDFDRIQTGDVLVTSTHSEAFNAVVQRLGAIVADTGGPLSHLSIVSREIGIPCIVTCKNATTLIKDGDRIRVDGESGRVTVID